MTSAYRRQETIQGARTLCHPLRTAAATGASRVTADPRLAEEIPLGATNGVNNITEMLNEIKDQNQRIMEQLANNDQEKIEERVKLVPTKTEVRASLRL